MELVIVSAVSVVVGFVAGAVIFYFYGKSAQAKIQAEFEQAKTVAKKVL